MNNNHTLPPNRLSSGQPEESSCIRGKNILEEARQKTPPEAFLEQLNDPLIFILFVAAAISMLLREFSDTAIILTVIMVNAVIGVIQEGKAQKALESLKQLTSPKALIKQNGLPVEIPACDLIPGDIVLLDAGRQVPADLRLTEVNSLKIEESALTGESVPVDKDTTRHNIAYMSTNVTYGRGEGIVTAIGMDTEIGKIARLINEAPAETTPLQKRLADLGKVLSIISIFLCVALFLIALYQKRDVMDMLLTAISLAVAAVPEGLPAIVTMVLALSVSRMVKVNTIVKKLPSVETLGCVSVVCSDKTGTLTQNKMSVTACYTDGKLYDITGLDPVHNKNFLEGFALCNDAVIDVPAAASGSGFDRFAPLRAASLPFRKHSGPFQASGSAGEESSRLGDPTELALLDMAAAYRLYRPHLELHFPRIGEIAFDSDRKMMTTLHKAGGSCISYTKGSVDEILKRCRYIFLQGRQIPLTASHRRDIGKMTQTLSARALRLLALGMRTGISTPSEEELTFVGLVGMMDPVRPEAADAVAEFNSAGVKTVMITGDRIDTAFAIAHELGIAQTPEQCMTGKDMAQLSDEDFTKALEQTTVFAHVSPEHKVRIVKGFKARGKIVAMTGDGVNDAPSLKTADVGIAMGITGTDVAKNAADIILTDDNFATIVKAISQGRCIYANIKKAVLFLLSSNFGEIITMLSAIILGLCSPLKASHILWINLITDSLPALALGVDSNDPKHYMKKPPRPKNENLFAHGGLSCTLLYGFLIAGVSMTAFLQLPVTLLHRQGLELTLDNITRILEVPAVLVRAQTYSFTVLGISQLFHAIGMRDTEISIFRMNHFSNKLMIAAFCIGLSLQLLVTKVPYFITAFGTCRLSPNEWGQLILLAAMPLLAHELLLLTPGAILKRRHSRETS